MTTVHARVVELVQDVPEAVDGGQAAVAIRRWQLLMHRPRTASARRRPWRSIHLKD
ncbi:MAG: hypothetical protein IT228_03425 [Flavobacteriales bacterium]|nr:hypothetical protein [Flavobacteriales bacterium]